MRDIFLHLKELKKERNAVIFSHYYQDPDIQNTTDFMGNSLALSQQAITTNADIIIILWCSFYVRNSKNYKSRKTGILPNINASCSLETIALEISISDGICIRTLKPLKSMMTLS